MASLPGLILSSADSASISKIVATTTTTTTLTTRGDEALRLATQELNESISLIPEEDKRAYLEAKKLAPSIVEKESNPHRFLRIEDNNPWNAAHRLTLYWKYRKELFGADRWLLPMNLSGHGAMSPGDVKQMKKDVLVFKKWSAQAAVVYSDFARAPEQDTTFAFRAMFYTVTVWGDEETDTNGIYVIKAIAPQLFLRRRTNRGLAWEIVRRALPLRIRQVFLLSRQTSQMSECLIRISVGMIKMVQEFFLGNPPVYISDMEAQQALATMASYGVPEQCIPDFLGGSWDLCGRPLSDQGTNEMAVPVSTASTSHALSLSPVMTNEPSNAKPKRKRGRPPKDISIQCTEDLREECDGHEEFTKKRNALYSRRLYRKKRREQDELQRQMQDLTAENERLKREECRLEGLIADARLQIAFADDDIFGKASAENPGFSSSSTNIQSIQPLS